MTPRQRRDPTGSYDLKRDLRRGRSGKEDSIKIGKSPKAQPTWLAARVPIALLIDEIIKERFTERRRPSDGAPMVIAI